MNILPDRVSYESEDGDVLPLPNPGQGERVEYFEPDTTDPIMIRAIHATRLIEKPQAPKSREIESKDTRERQAELGERVHFHALSRVELSSAIDLIGQDFVGGSATRLNMIFHRQKKYVKPEDQQMPSKTVRSIVRSWGEYANHARIERAFLDQLRIEADNEEFDESNEALMAALAEWLQQESTRRALISVERTIDLDRFIYGGIVDDPLGAGFYNGSPEEEKRLEEFLSSLGVQKLREFISMAMNQQKNRLDFWVKQLKGSEAHSLAKPVAEAELEKLGFVKEKS